jgi:hypothetical protein
MTQNKRTVLASIIGLLIVLQLFDVGLSVAYAQTSASRKRKPVYYSISANRTMRVRLNEDIGSERSRVGDTFTTTVVDPVYSKGGVLVIPEGSIVTGRVTNLQRAQRNGTPATLDVQFTSLRLPNGRSVPFNGSLTDLSGSNGNTDNEGTVTAKKTSKRNLKFIGGGAAGGAVIGAIAGGGKGLLIGGGIGAVTGLIAKKVKKGHEVKVDSGTEFGVILNRSIALPKYAGV